MQIKSILSGSEQQLREFLFKSQIFSIKTFNYLFDNTGQGMDPTFDIDTSASTTNSRLATYNLDAVRSPECIKTIILSKISPQIYIISQKQPTVSSADHLLLFSDVMSV